jgi:hypothetical protein
MLHGRDVEAGVQPACRLAKPIHAAFEHITVAEGGNRRWAETARRAVGLVELADDPEGGVLDVQQDRQ